MPPRRPARAAAPRAERTTPSPAGGALGPRATAAHHGPGRRRRRWYRPAPGSSGAAARPERHRGDVAPGRRAAPPESPGGAASRPATATSRRRSRRAIGRSRKCYVGRLGTSPPDVFGAAKSQVHARSGGLSRRPLRPDLGLRGGSNRRLRQTVPAGTGCPPVESVRKSTRISVRIGVTPTQRDS